MTGARSPSRPPSRPHRWWQSWCCVWAASARWACRSAVSTPRAKLPVWRPAARVRRQRRPLAGSLRPARWCTSGRTAAWWWPGSVRPRRCRGSRCPPRRQQSPNLAPGERGSATPLAAAGGAYLGAAVTARHRAQAAADLAALGAAGAVVSGPDAACRQATQVAARMRAVLADCRIDGLDVVLEVSVPVRLGRWGVGPARAVARAGPVDFAG